jgi:hypothetical protein
MSSPTDSTKAFLAWVESDPSTPITGSDIPSPGIDGTEEEWWAWVRTVLSKGQGNEKTDRN